MRKAIILFLLISSLTLQAKADIVNWNYEDDFSTEKVMSDSYDHSVFTSIYNSYAPALCLHPEDEYLLFRGAGESAFLVYAFPLENIITQVDSAVFDIEVFFASGGTYTPYLDYQLSNNGVDWSETSSLTEGYNQISLLPSDNPRTYIKLLGDNAWIDNLSVTVSGPEIPEPATLFLFALGGLLTRHRKNKS